VRVNFPGSGTSRVSTRLTDTVPSLEDKHFYRAQWALGS
jgi:hypothetical protein